MFSTAISVSAIRVVLSSVDSRTWSDQHKQVKYVLYYFGIMFRSYIL